MLLLIDIFSINKGRGYENPSLEIILIEHYSTGGFPLEEAHEHCFLNQSTIFVVVLISFMCYCGDYAGYITVIMSFLAFCFCFAYLLYLVYYTFKLKNAPTIFSRVVVEAFKEFLHKCLEAYFDDWTVFILLENHIECLRLMLDKCRQFQIALNLNNCIFFSPFEVFLGHIVCNQGLLVDPCKISIIVDLPPPTSVR
jgi:hypothetical protein